mgnify:CR=1 FL=1
MLNFFKSLLTFLKKKKLNFSKKEMYEMLKNIVYFFYLVEDKKKFFIKKFFKETFIFKLIFLIKNFFFLFWVYYIFIIFNKIINFFFFFFYFIFKNIYYLFIFLFYIFLSFFIIFNLFLIFYIFEQLQFLKIVSFWFSFFFFFYLFISGLNYFLKKYYFNKYNEALQRFWKRSFNIFWILEAFLFFCVFFLTMNSSNETLYFFDNQFFFKIHLFSWKVFIYKLFFINLIIFTLQINCKSIYYITFYKKTVKFLNFIVLYIVMIEFCQFLQFLNHSNYFFWEYDNNEWIINNEDKKSRVINNFILFCSILKFWHLFFIIKYWFFCFNKFIETGIIEKFSLYANLQNFILLFVLNCIAMLPWLKSCFRIYFNTNYFWLFNNNKDLFIKEFLDEFYLLFSNFF